MLRHGQLAAAAGFWLALYTAVHFLALRFLPPKRFAQRAAHERNLFVQYALSAAKGAFVFAAAARIAFGGGTTLSKDDTKVMEEMDPVQLVAMG